MLLKYGAMLSISKSPLLSQDPVAVVSSESKDSPARLAFLSNMTFSQKPRDAMK